MGEELETPVSRLLALDVEGASLQPHVADALRLAQYALRGSEAVHSAEVKRLKRRLERAADSGDAERRLRDATEELRTLKDELAERREELTEMQEQLDAAEARGAGEASGDYGGGGAAVQKLRLKNTALQEDLDDVRLRNKDLLKDLARKEEREEDLRRDLDKLRTRTREEGDEKRQMEEDLRAYKEQARGPSRHATAASPRTRGPLSPAAGAAVPAELDSTADSVVAREERSREERAAAAGAPLHARAL